MYKKTPPAYILDAQTNVALFAISLSLFNLLFFSRIYDQNPDLFAFLFNKYVAFYGFPCSDASRLHTLEKRTYI